MDGARNCTCIMGNFNLKIPELIHFLRDFQQVTNSEQGQTPFLVTKVLIHSSGLNFVVVVPFS